MPFDPCVARTLTELDHARLRRLSRALATTARHDDDVLERTLDDATVVPAQAIPADIVTMRSKVQLHDLRSARRYRLTLSYPDDAEPGAGRVSVLSPVGASLLGLRVGAEARWPLPGGEQGRARLEAIVFQPESHGEYAL